MKISNCFFICLLALFSCQKTDQEHLGHQQFDEGHYEGWFSYRGSNYWCLIQFENDRYEEWPSGGVMFQKSMACLTRGTYYVDDNSLVINPGSLKHEDFPDACDANTLLPGTYELINTGRKDSLVFAKGEGDNRIIYHVVNRTIGGKQ